MRHCISCLSVLLLVLFVKRRPNNLTADWWNEQTSAALLLKGSDIERNTSQPVYTSAAERQEHNEGA
ncbi:hypothetical protein PAMP_004975 [Pampus punctatissimus]